MKAWIAVLLLAITLPVTASATRQVDIGNSAGTLTGSASGLSVSDSTLTMVNNLYGTGLITGDLGTVAFRPRPAAACSLPPAAVWAPA